MLLDGASRARLVEAGRARSVPTPCCGPTRETWTEHRRRMSAAGWTPSGVARLSIRHDLHLGVGFLAATAGGKPRALCRFRRVPTPLGAICRSRGRRRDPRAADPRPWRHKGLVPADAGRARTPSPGDRRRPAGVRRLRQADPRTLRRARSSPRNGGAARCARARARRCGRQQHGWSGRARDRACGRRTGSAAWSCWRPRWPGCATARGRPTCGWSRRSSG